MITVALARREQPFIPVRKCTTQFECQKKNRKILNVVICSRRLSFSLFLFSSQKIFYLEPNRFISFLAELIWCIHISRQLNAHQTNAFVHTYQLCLRSIKDADFRQMCKTFKSMFVSLNVCVYELYTRKWETSTLEQFAMRLFICIFTKKKKKCTERNSFKKGTYHLPFCGHSRMFKEHVVFGERNSPDFVKVFPIFCCCCCVHLFAKQKLHIRHIFLIENAFR